jgi:hypothetical protein
MQWASCHLMSYKVFRAINGWVPNHKAFSQIGDNYFLYNLNTLSIVWDTVLWIFITVVSQITVNNVSNSDIYWLIYR